MSDPMCDLDWEKGAKGAKGTNGGRGEGEEEGKGGQSVFVDGSDNKTQNLLDKTENC